MYEKISYLKLNLYHLSSINADQQEDQRHLPVKYNKYRSSTENMIYVYGMTIGINTYGGTINTSELCKRLEYFKQSSKKNQ